jgi:redox-sensing transcriptional repressor
MRTGLFVMNPELSPLTLNRLSVYLRALRQVHQEGTQRISSLELANRFHLSAAQIRKDLAQFGELGIRGVGYDVGHLRGRLEDVLGLQREHRAVIVGAGNIGSALARFPGLNSGNFRVVGLFDVAPARIGVEVGPLRVQPMSELAPTVAARQVELGILSVPAEVAQENYEMMVRAGIRAVLNFAPLQLREHDGVRIKNVDLLIFLEELAHFLG